MDRPRLQDWTFGVPLPLQGSDGWRFAVEGLTRREFGPWADSGEVWAARERLFRRWCVHARTRGGWAWRPSAILWVVTVPHGVSVSGLPLDHRPCTRSVREG